MEPFAVQGVPFSDSPISKVSNSEKWLNLQKENNKFLSYESMSSTAQMFVYVAVYLCFIIENNNSIVK